MLRTSARYGFLVSCMFFVALAAAVEALPCPEDTDGDGVCDADDNCPSVSNSNQEDADADGVGDVCDRCSFQQDCSQPCPSENSCSGDFECAPGESCLGSCVPSFCGCDTGSWTCTDDCSAECFDDSCFDPTGLDLDGDAVDLDADAHNRRRYGRLLYHRRRDDTEY